MSTPDWDAIRADFPILDQEVCGKPLIYFDNAASSQKPRAVIAALSPTVAASVRRLMPPCVRIASSTASSLRDTLLAPKYRFAPKSYHQRHRKARLAAIYL